MPAVDITKRLRLYETSVLLKKEAFSGSVKDSFQITNGSRMVFTLQVLAKDPGAVLNLYIRNAFAVDLPLISVLQISANAVGAFSKVLTDFHNIFEVELDVTGGNADVAVGVTVADNANATRIENAVIETSVSAYPGIDGEYDSIRIGDGVDELDVLPDGSLPVTTVDGDGKEEFGQALAVASGVEVLIVQKTIGAGVKALLQRVEFDGTNIAEFRYYKNGVLAGVKHTYFSGPLNGEFNFFTGCREGVPLQAGDVVALKVIHLRPPAGDFSGRIQFLEVPV